MIIPKLLLSFNITSKSLDHSPNQLPRLLPYVSQNIFTAVIRFMICMISMWVDGYTLCLTLKVFNLQVKTLSGTHHSIHLIKLLNDSMQDSVRFLVRNNTCNILCNQKYRVSCMTMKELKEINNFLPEIINRKYKNLVSHDD